MREPERTIRRYGAIRGWLTLTEIAREAKVDPATLSDALRRGRIPWRRTVERLANALGLPVTEVDALLARAREPAGDRAHG
ncbi:MAG: helix-turn-helix domain-containing protein [Polyangiaceae bacterium]|nr:helix-turn-helix domain-containing protein [Polyangiaceae bacterium]